MSILQWAPAPTGFTAGYGNLSYVIIASKSFFSRRYAAHAVEDGISQSIGSDLVLADAQHQCEVHALARDQSPSLQFLNRIQQASLAGVAEPLRAGYQLQMQAMRLKLLGMLRWGRSHYSTPGGCEVGIAQTGAASIHRLVVPGTEERLILIDREWLLLTELFGRAIAYAVPFTGATQREVLAALQESAIIAYLQQDMTRLKPFQEWLALAPLPYASGMSIVPLTGTASAFANNLFLGSATFALGRELSRKRTAEPPPTACHISDMPVEEFRFDDAADLSTDTRGAELSSAALQHAGHPFALSWLGSEAFFTAATMVAAARETLSHGIGPGIGTAMEPMILRHIRIGTLLKSSLPPQVQEAVSQVSEGLRDAVSTLLKGAMPWLAHLHMDPARMPPPPRHSSAVGCVPHW